MTRGHWLCRACWFAVPEGDTAPDLCPKCASTTWLLAPPEGVNVWAMLWFAHRMPQPLAQHVVKQSLALLIKHKLSRKTR